MTGFMVTTQVGKARTEECRRITNMTPKRVELDTGVYARCEFSFSYGTVVIDLEFNVVADMLFSVFHDYMPTMDAVHRFMVSNPKTSADMLAEIQSKKSPASEGTAAMSEDEISDYFTPKHIELLTHLGFDKDTGCKLSYADARWLMMRATEDALHNHEAAMSAVARITRERGEK